MARLIYLSLMRLPTEKAHGLQIMQNCEAFAQAGDVVQLWVARRWNTAELRQVRDPFAHYGVQPVFSVVRIPCLDLMPLLEPLPGGARLAFYLQMFSFAFFLTLRALFTRADVLYARDELPLLLLSLFKPRRSLAYEAHTFARPGRGAWLQTQVCRRVGSIIAVTPPLAQDLIAQRAAAPGRVLVAHDGFRAARFAEPPAPAEARAKLGWPLDAFIVGYMGRLHTMGQDKGVDLLVRATATLPGAHLALVGGPDEMAAALREEWLRLGQSAAHWLYAGQVAAEAVPAALAALDVCVMPLPFTEHFAYYASPLKLFEYMAAGRAVVASDLPGWADVVQDGATALLIPPGDEAALRAALLRLSEDAALRQRLGAAARQRALALYTWQARAQAIRAHIAAA